MKYEFFLGLMNIILLTLSGWIAAFIGPLTRYLFFILGGTLSISAISSAWYWVILVLSVLYAFFLYGTAMKKINRGEAMSHVIPTVANSTSAYFVGIVVGLVAALIKYFIF